MVIPTLLLAVSLSLLQTSAAARCSSDAMDTLSNGLVWCSDEFYEGSVCTYSCDKYYQLEGPSSIICSRNKWSGPRPTCKASLPAKNCQPWSDWTPCSYADRKQERTQICETRIFINNGWQTETDIKNEYRDCVSAQYGVARCSSDAMDTLSNGLVWCSNEFYEGSVCTYSCDKYYQLEGPNSITCSGNKWSGPRPTCKAWILSSLPAKKCGPWSAWTPCSYRDRKQKRSKICKKRTFTNNGRQTKTDIEIEHRDCVSAQYGDLPGCQWAAWSTCDITKCEHVQVGRNCQPRERTKPCVEMLCNRWGGLYGKK